MQLAGNHDFGFTFQHLYQRIKRCGVFTQALVLVEGKKRYGAGSFLDNFTTDDRAILKTFLWSGIRLGTGCRLKVSDFHQDGDEATLRLHEKGDKRRTIGLHFHAGQAISEYIVKAGIASGPLFRPRLGPRSQKLADRPLEASSMYLLIESYL